MDYAIKNFFANSDTLDYLVLRPLSHINLCWELTWDHSAQEYEREEDTYASILNDLIIEIANTTPPLKYHDHEDILAEYVKNKMNWNIERVGNWWIGESYEGILAQGGFSDTDEKHLITAATGRVKAAIESKQNHFDEMEEGHQKILAAVMAIILYHRMTLLPKYA